MAKLLDTFVSVVLIGDSYSRDLSGKVRRISEVLKEHYANYEVVVVDNGILSVQLKQLKEKVLLKLPCIRVVRLAKSDDIDTAVFAGIESAIGDHICILYNDDPPNRIPDFITTNLDSDIVFGIASNFKRNKLVQKLGANLYYWYNRRYLHIDIPRGSTYFVCINRNVANAISSSDSTVRLFRHMAKIVGFTSTNLNYELTDHATNTYSTLELIHRAINSLSSYSSHPLRALSSFGLFASLLNVIYAVYVVVINLSQDDVAQGWTSLSLQSALMFFLLFILIAILAEYVGKILVEARGEPPYHIMEELSSTVNFADETRRNIVK